MNIIISEFCCTFDAWKTVGLNVFWLNCSDERNHQRSSVVINHIQIIRLTFDWFDNQDNTG